MKKLAIGIILQFLNLLQIFPAYADRQLQTWIDLGLISEPAVDAALNLPEKLRGLYSSLKNFPAVMDRRLQISGSKPPSFEESGLDVEVMYTIYMYI